MFPACRWLRASAAALASWGLVPTSATDPLRGEYGFLTDFGSITEAEARSRVRYMWDVFRILEFQFYDAFEGYSHPPSATATSWKSSFGRLVRRDILLAYTDEIRRLGGRSWFYVQAMGIDPNDQTMQIEADIKVIGQHLVDDKPLLDVVVPNAELARVIAAKWASFVKPLGFDGIHWDTLGKKFGVVSAGGDLPGFLRAAHPILRGFGLAQSCNFVDGYGWDASLYGGVGWFENVVAFPYWEVWTRPENEDRFFREAAPRGGGVFVCYPGRSDNHKGEDWNKDAVGTWPLDLLILRWQKARCHGSTYLAIGDGAHHVQMEYFPDTAKISDADAIKIRDAVFKECSLLPTCPGHVERQSNSLSCYYALSALGGLALFGLGRCSVPRARSRKMLEGKDGMDSSGF